MDLPDPIQDAKDRLAELDAAVAQTALAAARENMQGLLGRRSLGFAVVDSVGKGDGRNYRVVITDGTQDGVIIARLSGTRLATRGAADDPEGHLVERLHEASGSLPNDGNRWLNMVLQPQPMRLG